MSALIERVRPIVAPILADLGLDLYDLEMQSGTVRVTVDRNGGVDLEAIALATRLISRELDHRDPIPGKYTLEVSSPGLERNLRTPDHFHRVIGWKVQVRTHGHVPGDRRVHGLLVSADDDGFVVRPELDGGAPARERRLAYTDVDRAKTMFEWAGQPKPGQPKPAVATRDRGSTPKVTARAATSDRARVERSPSTTANPTGARGRVRRPAAPSEHDESPDATTEEEATKS